MLLTETPAGTSGVGEGSILLMNLPTPLSRVFRIDWFDWRSSATRDSVALFGFTVLAAILAYVYELGPYLFQVGMEYAEWKPGNIIFVVFVLNKIGRAHV